MGVPGSYALTVTNIGVVPTTAVATASDDIPASLILGAMPAGCTRSWAAGELLDRRGLPGPEHRDFPHTGHAHGPWGDRQHGPGERRRGYRLPASDGALRGDHHHVDHDPRTDPNTNTDRDVDGEPDRDTHRDVDAHRPTATPIATLTPTAPTATPLPPTPPTPTPGESRVPGLTSLGLAAAFLALLGFGLSKLYAKYSGS